jgi:hypothetical protein
MGYGLNYLAIEVRFPTNVQFGSNAHAASNSMGSKMAGT